MSLGSGGNLFAGGPQQLGGGPGSAPAFNGTSVDPGTGNIMLGDFTNDPVNGPSKLVNFTSIPINGFSLDFFSQFNIAGAHQRINIDDFGMAFSGVYAFPTNRNMTLMFREEAVNAGANMYQDTEQLVLQMVDNNVVNSSILFRKDGRIVYQGLTFTSTSPEGDFTIAGSAAFRTVFSTTAVDVGVIGQGNFSISNQGAAGPVILDISGSSPAGCRITAHLYNGNQVSISGANEIIRAGLLTTAVGGAISSTTAGSSITLECIESAVTNPIWQATSLTGTWTV